MKHRCRGVPHSALSRKKATEAFAVVLRNHMTRAEMLFWKCLKVRQKNWKQRFLPQQVVYGYIPDFYCDTLKLAVEIDGDVHRKPDVKRNDRLRTRRLNNMGITIVRFKNKDVFSGVHRLISALEKVCR